MNGSPLHQKKTLELIKNNDKLKKIYDSQVKKLIEAVSKCKKIEFQLIRKYRDVLIKLLIDNLGKLFKANIEKELFFLPLSLNFTLKFGSDGLLVDHFENSLNLKIMKQPLPGKSSYELAFTTCGLATAFVREFSIKQVSSSNHLLEIPAEMSSIMGKTSIAFLVLGLTFHLLKGYSDNHVTIVNSSSKIQRELLKNSSNFSGIIHQFFLEKKVNEVPLFAISSDKKDKKKVILEINQESKKKMSELFNDYFLFKDANTKNNEISVKIINEEKITLEWKPENSKNKSLGVNLNVCLRMNIPKNETIEQELETIIDKKKQDVWHQLKTTGNYNCNN